MPSQKALFKHGLTQKRTAFHPHDMLLDSFLHLGALGADHKKTAFQAHDMLLGLFPHSVVWGQIAEK